MKVKHWTTPNLREQWRREDPDSAETVKTVKVVNALTGDIVEYIANHSTVESEDIIMAETGEDDEAVTNAWIHALKTNGDREVVLPPDQWDSFFKACEQAFWEALEDLNGPRKPLGYEKELVAMVGELSDALGSAHQDVMDNGHEGYEGECSCCMTIKACDELLANLRKEVVL